MRVLTLRPLLNMFEIKKRAVLDQVQIGVFFGYEMPLWTVHEELFMAETAPGRWSGVADLTVVIHVALGGVEDVGDRFQFRLSWEHAEHQEPVPATFHDVDVETVVIADRAAQYDLYMVPFTVDYDIGGVGHVLMPYQLLGMRLRRIAATVNEVTNDIIVMDWHIHWPVDKMFAPPMSD